MAMQSGAAAARGAIRMASSSAAAPRAGRPLFLGLDSSTQGLKATAIDADLNVAHTFAVNYQRDLSHYKTTNGVHTKPGNVVTQPTVMVCGVGGAMAAPPRSGNAGARSSARVQGACHAGGLAAPAARG
jgi:sugar (pentulose or hexulose) kinase